MREKLGDLEAKISVHEQLEDGAALALIADRANGQFVPASDKVIDGVFADFESTISSRSEGI